MTDRDEDYATRKPHPRLRPFVTEYTGFRMGGIAPGVHSGISPGTLTLIIAFDDKLDRCSRTRLTTR